MREILAITPNQESFNSFHETMGEGYRLTLTSNRISGFEAYQAKRFDLCFVDINMIPRESTDTSASKKNLIKDLQQIHPDVPLVLIANDENTEMVISLSAEFGCIYLNYPLTLDEIKLALDKAFRAQIQKAEIQYLRDQFWNPESLHLINSTNTKMRGLLENVKSVAPTKSTVLLNGETGVGKSVFAQLIHQHSNRKEKQFIHVHCGAITESLLESELFGHEKGSFTGAFKRKLGKFELAHGGTIFLDEISTLTVAAQIKLLQVLQNGTFQRVGGEIDVTVDIRVIAATNENLEELAQQGKFRKDLLYRLNVFPLCIPPLRERLEDLPGMIEVFLKELNGSHQKGISSIQPEAIQTLSQYDWPGNVRELENLVERAYIIEKSNVLTTEGFPLEIIKKNSQNAVLPLNIDLPLAEARSRTLENFERQYLKELLSKSKGKISMAAEIAGIGVRQLNKLMHKYQLDKKDFKDEGKPLFQ